MSYLLWDVIRKFSGLSALWKCLSYEEKLLSATMVGRTMLPPKGVHFLVSRTCEYITLHGKMNFEAMIKLMILEWGE